jgi:hypothetical protein
LRYVQTQEHPGSKAVEDTQRGAARAAAGTTVTSGIVAACAKHLGLPDAEIERTWPSASSKELIPPMQRLLIRPCQDKRDSVLQKARYAFFARF